MITSAEQLKARLAQFHKNPEQIPGMAIEVWEDGEITSTKCCNGELYGARTLHTLVSGIDRSLPIDLFPESNRFHAFVRCDSMKNAELVREIIVSNLTDIQ